MPSSPSLQVCSKEVFGRRCVGRGSCLWPAGIRKPSQTATRCGFRRLRTPVPIEGGQWFRSIADSLPMITDTGSPRRIVRSCRYVADICRPTAELFA
jgi:hypothetical protein